MQSDVVPPPRPPRSRCKTVCASLCSVSLKTGNAIHVKRGGGGICLFSACLGHPVCDGKGFPTTILFLLSSSPYPKDMLSPESRRARCWGTATTASGNLALLGSLKLLSGCVEPKSNGSWSGLAPRGPEMSIIHE